LAATESQEGKMQGERKANSRVYDFFKHLTTLNTAAILLALTLIEKFLHEYDGELLTQTFCAFGVSLVLSLVMMMLYAFCLGHLWFDGRLGCVSGGISLFAIHAFLYGVWHLVVVVMQSMPPPTAANG
jgi:hypothetical protein